MKRDFTHKNFCLAFNFDLLILDFPSFNSLGLDFLKRSSFRPLVSLFFAAAILVTTQANAQMVEQEFLLPAVSDATVSSLDGSANYGSNPDLIALTWETNTEQFTFRSYFRFDLSSLPEGELVDATLSLFATSNSGNPQHYGFNEALLLRVEENWAQETITWDNQPSTTIEEAVFIPRSDEPGQHYDQLSISSSVEASINSNSPDMGFALQLQSETIYKSLNFASSDHPNEELHPVLRVTMNVPDGSTGFDDDFTMLSGLNVYPNPCIGQKVMLAFTLDEAAEIEVEILDGIGRQLESAGPFMKGVGDGSIELHSSDLPSGHLFVRLLADGRQAGTMRILKIN